jgi:hypothetical protein
VHAEVREDCRSPETGWRLASPKAILRQLELRLAHILSFQLHYDQSDLD